MSDALSISLRIAGAAGEVATDEVLDIVDKPGHTLPQCAKEIRLLTEWTARQREQNTKGGQKDDETPT